MAVTAAVLDLQSDRLHLFVSYASPRYFERVESNGLSVHEKKYKIGFQAGRYWSSDLNDFSYFYLQIFPISFESFGLIGLGEEFWNWFSKWWQSWIFDQKDFRYFFNLQITLILPTKVCVNLPFCSGEKVLKGYLTWRLCHSSLLCDQNNLTIFGCTSHPDITYQVWSHLAVPFRRRI